MRCHCHAYIGHFYLLRQVKVHRYKGWMERTHGVGYIILLCAVYGFGPWPVTLCEPTKQHFLLLPQLYSHRTGQSVCHNHTSVCFKDINSPPLRPHVYLTHVNNLLFCWVQFLHNLDGRGIFDLVQFNTFIGRGEPLHPLPPATIFPPPQLTTKCDQCGVIFPVTEQNTQWRKVTEAGKWQVGQRLILGGICEGSLWGIAGCLKKTETW